MKRDTSTQQIKESNATPTAMNPFRSSPPVLAESSEFGIDLNRRRSLESSKSHRSLKDIAANCLASAHLPAWLPKPNKTHSVEQFRIESAICV